MKFSILRILFSLAFFGSHLSLNATNLVVNTSTDSNVAGGGSGVGLNGDLRYVLNYMNTHGADTYNVSFSFVVPTTITINGMLPILNLNNSNTVVINGGSNVTINGSNTFRGFFANAGNITVQNLNLQNTAARGGTGGGMAGGALFVNAGTVTLSNVQITNAIVQGGAAGAARGFGGGGGMGGNGGTASSSNAGSGGGGLGDSTSSTGAPGSSGGGGGKRFAIPT